MKKILLYIIPVAVFAFAVFVSGSNSAVAQTNSSASNASTPIISITSPKQGDTLIVGERYLINWNGYFNDVNESFDIQIFGETGKDFIANVPFARASCKGGYYRLFGLWTKKASCSYLWVPTYADSQVRLGINLHSIGIIGGYSGTFSVIPSQNEFIPIDTETMKADKNSYITILNPSSENVKVGVKNKIMWKDSREKGATPIYMITLIGAGGKGVIAEKLSATTYCKVGVCTYDWTPDSAYVKNQIYIYDTVNDSNGQYPGISKSFEILAAVSKKNCGLTVSSPAANSQVNFPLTIQGTIDNKNYQKTGCSWGMFEGTGGMAQLYYKSGGTTGKANNGWNPIGPASPINVASWTTIKTTFISTINFNNGGIGLSPGTPMKVVFTEENPKGDGNEDTYELPVYLKGTSAGQSSVTVSLTDTFDLSVVQGDVRSPILGLNITAANSDITVQRIRLNLGTNMRFITKVLKTLYLFDGSTQLSAATSNDVIKDGDMYFVYINNLLINIPKGSQKTLSIRADIQSAISATDVGRYSVGIPASGIRVTDTNGLTQYLPASGLYRYLGVSGSTVSDNNSSSAPSIKVLSPNGGENWQVGSTNQFRWTASNAKSIVINLDNLDNGTRYGTDDSALIPSSGAFNWTVRNLNLPPGRYRAVMTAMNGNLAAYDSSDNYFNIIPSSVTTVVAPIINSLSSSYGPKGTKVVVNLSNYKDDPNNSIEFRSQTVAGGTSFSGRLVNGELSFIVPDFALGNYSVTFTSDINGASNKVNFILTSPAPVIYISPTSGPAGTDVVISVQNYKDDPNNSLEFHTISTASQQGGTSFSGVSTDGRTIKFKAPNYTYGTYWVQLNSDVNGASNKVNFQLLAPTPSPSPVSNAGYESNSAAVWEAVGQFIRIGLPSNK